MSMFSKSFKVMLLAVSLILATTPWVSAQKVVEESPGWLGVSIQDVTEELKATLPRGVHEGALINGVVEESPADIAGLQEGDVIVKIDQARVRNSADLTEAVRNSKAGQTAQIEYYRDGGRRRVEAVLAEHESATVWQPRSEGRKQGRRHRATEEPEAYFFEAPGPHAFGFMAGATPRLGVELSDLSDQLAEYFGVESGVLVTKVMEESAAEAAGLKAGDVITSVGLQSTGSSEEVRDALGDIESGPVEITVIRRGQEQTVTADLQRPKRAHLSGFHGPSAPMLNIPDVSWDQEEFKSEMEDLRKELKQLQKELSEMRGDSR